MTQQQISHGDSDFTHTFLSHAYIVISIPSYFSANLEVADAVWMEYCCFFFSLLCVIVSSSALNQFLSAVTARRTQVGLQGHRPKAFYVHSLHIVSMFVWVVSIVPRWNGPYTALFYDATSEGSVSCSRIFWHVAALCWDQTTDLLIYRHTVAHSGSSNSPKESLKLSV